MKLSGLVMLLDNASRHGIKEVEQVLIDNCIFKDHVMIVSGTKVPKGGNLIAKQLIAIAIQAGAMKTTVQRWFCELDTNLHKERLDVLVIINDSWGSGKNLRDIVTFRKTDSIPLTLKTV